MHWQDGRQGKGYSKLCLAKCRWFDCYLIRFSAGFQLPVHSDEVTGKRHYRLNILLRGEDAYVGDSIFRWWRIVLFRADQPHGTTLLSKDRLLFSIGWSLKHLRCA